MFQVLHGLTYIPKGPALPVAQTVWLAFGNEAEARDPGFIPRFLSFDSPLYTSLFGEHSMMALGLDLSRSVVTALADGFASSIPYVLLVVLLGGLPGASPARAADAQPGRGQGRADEIEIAQTTRCCPQPRRPLQGPVQTGGPTRQGEACARGRDVRRSGGKSGGGGGCAVVLARRISG